MKENEEHNTILDKILLKDNKSKQTYDLEASFAWWERKRIWFNVWVGLSGFLTIVVFFQSFSWEVFFGIFIWGSAANLLFSVGFLVEAADKYYFKNRLGIRRIKQALFLAGTVLYSFATILYGMMNF